MAPEVPWHDGELDPLGEDEYRAERHIQQIREVKNEASFPKK